MLDLVRLKTLQRFAECGTIASAAATLGYTPSAVSQQISALERDVGAALLERTAKKASLTPAGRALASKAVDLIDLAEAIESDMANIVGTVSGRLEVSAIPNLATLAASHLGTLQQQYPQLELILREGIAEQVLSDVTRHVSDIAITDSWSGQGSPVGAGLTQVQLARETIYLARSVSGSTEIRQGTVSSDELRSIIHTQTWLCAPEGHASRRAGDQFLADIDVAPTRRWEFEGLITIADLIRTGLGIGLLPEFLARQQAGLELIAVPDAITRTVHAVARTVSLQQPTVAAALDVLRRGLS